MIEQVSVSRKQLDSARPRALVVRESELLLDGYAARAWESSITVRRGTTQNVTTLLSAGGELEF